MSLIDLYNHYNISHVKDRGHKHARPGWINCECPFCSGNPGYHLGYNYEEGYFRCWRCGFKRTMDAISGLLGVGYNDAVRIAREYSIRSRPQKSFVQKEINRKEHKLPSETGKMAKRHRNYLIQRNFDPDYLEQVWGVLGTGPTAELDGSYYSHRILAPIYWEGERVSFQARDITGLHPVKYMACSLVREVIHHQKILYGLQEDWRTDIGICVEGITDVWRLGTIAFAVFGIEFSISQVRMMVKYFERVIILFDDDPQAVEKAKELKFAIEELGGEAYIETIQGDPAELSQNEANKLVEQIIKTYGTY